MKKILIFLLIASSLIFLLDLATLGNQTLPYHQDPMLGPLGSAIGVISLVGIGVGFLATLFLGIARLFKGRPSSASSQLPPPTSRQNIYRHIKIAVGVLALLFALFGLPYLFMKRVVDPAMGLGDFIGNLFISCFAFGVQLIVPNPFSLTVWPFVAATVFFLFSRKAHYVLDTLAFLVLIASAVGIWSVFVKATF